MRDSNTCYRRESKALVFESQSVIRNAALLPANLHDHSSTSKALCSICPIRPSSGGDRSILLCRRLYELRLLLLLRGKNLFALLPNRGSWSGICEWYVAAVHAPKQRKDCHIRKWEMTFCACEDPLAWRVIFDAFQLGGLSGFKQNRKLDF